MTPHRFLETPRGRFATLETGPASGRPLLLLHGFPDTPASFVPLAAELAAFGFRCHVPWLRGYAPSPLDGDVTLEGLVLDVRALLDAIGPVEAVVGHDWGAMITWLLATDHPPFGRAVTMAVPHPLAFLGNALRSPAQLHRSRYMLRFQFDEVDFAYIERLWRRWSPGFDPGRQYWQHLRETLDASLPRPLEYYRALVRPFEAALARLDRDPRVHVPMLQLMGANDGCIAPEIAAGQERYARLVDARVLPGVGHFLHLEDPVAVGRLIGAFL